MSQIAIIAEGLGKRYQIGALSRRMTLGEQLTQLMKSPARLLGKNGRASYHQRDLDFWALRDVSFELQKGEVMGLIGRNGAGKSTLLKILSRVTQPTTGRAEIHGRVGSLLEVGTGFHPELTGRENTYLNGAILGMGKKEIDRKFDEIVAFAEVEKFIDTSLKHYSTGMQMRLAFAVAAHLEPETLLVDEVLAVGDSAFQKKCLGKMGEVASGGRTIVFVSHQLNQIRRLCEKVVWMDAGTIRSAGRTTEIVCAYETAMASGTESSLEARGEKVRFLSWRILQPESESPNMLTSFEPVTIRFTVNVSCTVDRGHHGIALFNIDRQLIWAWSKHGIQLKPGLNSFDYTFPMLPLRPGAYTWQVSLWEDTEMLELWDCLPELNVATEVLQDARDEWNGILNIPFDFEARNLHEANDQKLLRS